MFEPLRDSSMAKEKKMDAREFEELSRKLYEKQDQIEMQKRELLEKQSEMEESLDRYADLYDFAPNGYFTLDENGIIKDINYTGAQMLGVQKKLVLGLPFIHFLSKDNFQKYLNDLRDARQSFAQVSDDFQINPEKKMDCFIHLVLTPLRDYRNN
jgi:PAS domain S-box-containing protein